MQRLDGAQQLDGEDHCQQLVHDAARLGAEGVDDVEQRAVRVVGQHQEGLVAVQVQLVRVRQRRRRPVPGAHAPVGHAHHVELPGRRRRLRLDGLEPAAPAHGRGALAVVGLVVGLRRRVLHQVDGREGAGPELSLQPVRRRRVRELQHNGLGRRRRAPVGPARGHGELTYLAAAPGPGVAVVVEAG